MKAQYLHFSPDEEIPALPCIRKRKLVKYYTRETLAAHFEPFCFSFSSVSIICSKTWR